MADVFISYSSVNKDAANAICHVLEENGVRCWIAPRDILQGFDYGDVIEKAICSCKLFVLVYSKTAAVSPWVKGEVNIAFTEGKTILPYRIDETLLDGGLRVMLNQYHWIDSYPDYKRCFKDLLTSVEANLGQTEKQIISPKPQPVQDNEPTQRETEVDTVCEDRQMISDIRSKLGKAQTDEIIKQPDPTPKPNYTKYILGALVVALSMIVGIWLGNREPTPPEPTAEDVVADIIYEEPTASVEPVTIDSAAISQQAVAEYKKQEEAAIRNGNTFTVKGVSFTMIAVKGGSYTMGCTSEQGSDCYSDEKPAHSEYVSDFMIGETEVTQALWQAVMGNNPSYFTGDMQRPVENVSWDDCQTFIRKLNQLTGENFRLPNEAEWEYAARGGNKSRGYKYSGSNNVGTVAWYNGNSGNTTHRVKTKQPNELGIYDMSGNVREWCQDEHSSDYNSPRNSGLRVLRGGSWINSARNVRVSIRFSLNPGLRNYYYGLRLAF